MRTKSPKKPKRVVEYPYLNFRPTPLMERRLRALSEQTNQSVGALIRECVSAHLHVLEAGKQ